jgi:hypothetical protein
MAVTIAIRPKSAGKAVRNADNSKKKAFVTKSGELYRASSLRKVEAIPPLVRS